MRIIALVSFVLSSLFAVHAVAAPDAATLGSKGRKGPWVRCDAEMKPPRRTTFAYSAADAREMARLQAEVIAHVNRMNDIVRRTSGKPPSTGGVVQFTLFTGCPDGPGGDAMMEFIQQPESTEAPDSFFDIDVTDYGGSGGGGNGGSGGCHCETNQVSCQGPCPC